MQKMRKILRAVSEKTALQTNQPTNQPTNQLLPVTPILKDLADTCLKSPGWHQSKKPDMSDSHRNTRVLCNYKLKLPKF